MTPSRTTTAPDTVEKSGDTPHARSPIDDGRHPARARRHHGNLRAALVDAGIAMVESGEPFSLRAAARRVGVSPTATYRHFENKERLEAAVAAHGFHELRSHLGRAAAGTNGGALLITLALTTVDYARDNPAMYALMFAQPRGDDDERLAASAALLTLVEQRVHDTLPNSSSTDLATAGWAMTHGFAMLAMTGKFGDPRDPDVGATVDDMIRRSFTAMLTAR